MMWEKIVAASPTKCTAHDGPIGIDLLNVVRAECEAMNDKRNQRALYQLAAKQRFVDQICAASNESEAELTYASLENALQARAQAAQAGNTMNVTKPTTTARDRFGGAEMAASVHVDLGERCSAYAYVFF
ncbi:hypothetical protein LTR27_007143 [Elasticomyces elasticus]|nr:hypothetical protein LTR27_007143 [Elasticomyces elasticus]